MTSTDRRASARGAVRRAQLAAIAADLFRRHGYHNVGVGDIAAAAGLTGPALYRHFASKSAILGHVVLDGFDVFASAITTSDGLGALAESAARVMVERRELGTLWRREGRNLPASDRALLAARARHTTRVGSALLREARPSLSDADADLVTWAVMSVFGSVSDHHVVLPRARFEVLLTSMALAVAAVDPAAARAARGHSGAADVPHEPAQDANGDAGSAAGRGGEAGGRRELLLASAARSFGEHGFHAVTLEDVATAAGVTGPAIYRHFASKADVLLAMCARIGDELRAGVEAASGLAPRATVDALVRSFVATVLGNRDFVAAYLSEASSLPAREREELRRSLRAYVARWADALRDVDPGLDEREARVRVHAAFAVVNDLARTARFRSRPALAAELTALAAAALTPPTPTP